MKGTEFQLISEILRGSWMIQEAFALDLMPKVAELLKGNPVSFYDRSTEQNMEASAGFFMAADGAGRLQTIDAETPSDLPEDTVAVLNLSGVVMKNDFCGVAGTASLRHALMEALAAPNVSAAIIKIDSPGGAVNGSFELYEAFANAAKPTFGFIDGNGLSAGYLIPCGCTEIHASHQSAHVGSIGVMQTLRDYSAQLKKEGVKEEVIVSKTSPLKNKKYRDALNGEKTALQETLLMPLDALFMDAVKTHRPDVSQRALDGDDMLAEEAMKNGLIDGIGSFETVVERALDIGAYVKQKNSISI